MFRCISGKSAGAPRTQNVIPFLTARWTELKTVGREPLCNEVLRKTNNIFRPMQPQLQCYIWKRTENRENMLQRTYFAMQPLALRRIKDPLSPHRWRKRFCGIFLVEM